LLSAFTRLAFCVFLQNNKYLFPVEFPVEYLFPVEFPVEYLCPVLISGRISGKILISGRISGRILISGTSGRIIYVCTCVLITPFASCACLLHTYTYVCTYFTNLVSDHLIRKNTKFLKNISKKISEIKTLVHEKIQLI
jgi:hypothetical protein